MSKDTVTIYEVAGERFDTKKAAGERADELERANAEAYREQAKALEQDQARAAKLLGRRDVTLALPPPPPPVEVTPLELVRAFEVHALEPAGAELGGEPPRTVAVGQVLDEGEARGELARLEQAPADGDWRGPRHRYELVERLVTVDEADRLRVERAKALEAEAKAERKADRA